MHHSGIYHSQKVDFPEGGGNSYQLGGSVNISIQGYNQSLDLWRNSNRERPRICENRYGMVKLALKSIRNAIVRRDDYIKQSSIIYSDKLN